MAWNDEAITKLVELFGRGLAASRIAFELNLGFSRNAVIGKINRMGLRYQGQSHAEHEIERKKAKAKAIGRKEKRPRPHIRPGYSAIENHYIPFLPPEPAKPETMKCCTQLQLTKTTCRWPIGDPREHDFHFCGNDVAFDEAVYCGYHMRIAHARRGEAVQEAQK